MRSQIVQLSDDFVVEYDRTCVTRVMFLWGNATYHRLTDDGLTQWHPAFLQLSKTLDDCAKRYKGFCQRYQPKKKEKKKCGWGSKFLAVMGMKDLKKVNQSGEQLWLPLAGYISPGCQVSKRQPEADVEKFILANRSSGVKFELF